VSGVKEIPLEVLFGNPERVQPQLSPDGARLAYIAPVDGVLKNRMKFQEFADAFLRKHLLS
jgi:hypothetical protein